MISMYLSEAAREIQGTMIGRDAFIRGCSTDSRRLRPGEMFIALRGERFDGHDYLMQAREDGASAAVVDRDLSDPLPRIRVADTRIGLTRLAAGWRKRFAIPVLAVTGSNGKTTVKEMLSAILSEQGKVLATRGNLNNDIGVPLTLFRMSARHAYAVIEMGANHPGEIAELTALARPEVAVVTVCAPAHLEGFGSVEGVARAKGEIFSGLSDDGVAVINADDAYAGLLTELAAGRRIVTFSCSSAVADVKAVDHGPASEAAYRCAEIETPAGAFPVKLSLLGRHSVQNAAAATACAYALGIRLEHCRAGLEALRPLPGRLEIKRGCSASRMIDDSYNANPSSLAAGLDLLQEFPGEHWLVLGDMGELGPEAERLHVQAGETARRRGLHRLYTIGELSRGAAETFGTGARHFESLEALAEDLRRDLHCRVTLLVKASRAMRLERLVKLLGEEAVTSC